MKKIVLVVLLISSIACKSDKKSNEINEPSSQEAHTVSKESEYPNFTILFRAKVLLDDKFRLLYTEELGEKFSGKEIVFTDVKGSEDFQTIRFVLPKKDIYPIRLRLNVGNNKEQKGIIIESIEIAHDDNKLKISSTEFYKYFYPNKYIEYNRENGEVTFKEEDGKHFPFFVSRGPLHDELMIF